MTTVTDLSLQGVVAQCILAGPTIAGANVFAPRDWPTKPDGMPIVLVQAPREEKVGQGRSGYAIFECIVTVRVIGRVYAKAGAGEAGAIAALAAVGQLKRQIEVAVIENALLRAAGVQAFAKVRSVADVKAEGEFHFGEVVMEFDLEFVQGPGDFHPIDADPMEEIRIFADLINVFSPTGVFEDTPFADDAQPAPRTSGPDGRPEGQALITIEQE